MIDLSAEATKRRLAIIDKADAYHKQFTDYHNETGRCPNCNGPMELPSCPCGCEFPPTLNRWVMRHYVERAGQRICDCQEPLWEWKERKNAS